MPALLDVKFPLRPDLNIVFEMLPNDLKMKEIERLIQFLYACVVPDEEPPIEDISKDKE